MTKHKKPADSYVPAACFAAFLLIVVFAPFRVGLSCTQLAVKLQVVVDASGDALTTKYLAKLKCGNLHIDSRPVNKLDVLHQNF